jgi:tRNA (cytidine/uridine-2'-O-)-methyltransferase
MGTMPRALLASFVLPLKATQGKKVRAIWRMETTPTSGYGAAPRLALYQPDIPQNTGTMLRMAACLGLGVDIIQPTGFDMSDRTLRRAALDYLDQVTLTRHTSWEAFEAWRRAADPARRLVLLTTHGALPYLDFRFAAGDILMVGRESAGVPEAVHRAADARVRVPIRPGLRSLNVAVAAAMVVGEAVRQARTA